MYNNLRYVFVAVVYRMARKSRQNTPRNMYKGTAEILYFILPYPDFGNGRHFCKEKARTQWRSSRQCALSRMDRLCAKDGATSDAESFAVTGTVSHIRQMPRIKRPGWRSAFFLFPTRLSFDISGACSTLGNTKIQGTEFMIQRNQKS